MATFLRKQLGNNGILWANELKYYLDVYVYIPSKYFIHSFLKLSLSLSRYRSDRFGNRVIVIDVADLDKGYRIIVIEAWVKLWSVHHC